MKDVFCTTYVEIKMAERREEWRADENQSSE
jgi:hypothetical protein